MGLFGRDAVISLGNEQDPMERRAQLNVLDLPESETDEDLKLAIDSLGNLAMQLVCIFILVVTIQTKMVH